VVSTTTGFGDDPHAATTDVTTTDMAIGTKRFIARGYVAPLAPASPLEAPAPTACAGRNVAFRAARERTRMANEIGGPEFRGPQDRDDR
jgi:hypothetical protein